MFAVAVSTMGAVMRRCYCVPSKCNVMDLVGDAVSADESPFVALLWVSGAHDSCRLFGCKVPGVIWLVQAWRWNCSLDGIWGSRLTRSRPRRG